MEYPNAYSGVKKIFTAEIIGVIAFALVLLAVIAGVAGMAGASSVNDIAAGPALLAVGGMMVGGLLAIIASIMNLVGLHQAGKDEPQFLRIAFWVGIGSIILAVILGVIFQNSSTATSFSSAVTSACNLVVFLLTVKGISVLADKLEEFDLVELGTKLIYVFAVFAVLSLVSAIASNFVGAIALLISLVLSVCGMIIYLVYLSRAKVALQK